jgi:trans-aconitate methyltransferase
VHPRPHRNRSWQVIADIGCSTGLYTRQLATFGATVICADPSQAMLDQLPGDPALVPVRASAPDIAEHRIRSPPSTWTRS